MEKITFWCHNVRGFLEMVATQRGKILEECNIKIGGDTGKGFLKITASIFTPGTETLIGKRKKGLGMMEFVEENFFLKMVRG